MKGYSDNRQLKYRPSYTQPKNISHMTHKQPLQAFLNLFVNVHYLISISSSNDFYQKYFTEHSIAKHLQKFDKQSDLQSQNLISNNNTIIDTFNKTGPTVVEDENSQYQTYLKEYESVIKNSRRKEYISPVNHKEEINQLISEFLSDKHKAEDNIIKRTEKSKPKNITAIKIQKIDLDLLKANHTKNIRSETTPDKMTKDNDGYSKGKDKRPCSPRFVKISESNRAVQHKKQTKINNNPSITVVKVEKPKLHSQNQQTIVQYPLSTSKPTSKAQYKQTYLKKKTAQLQKTQPLLKKVEKTEESYKIATVNRSQRVQQYKVARKPIKIQIQIPLQDSEEEEQDAEQPSNHMQASQILEHEQQQIIKQISERVMTLLHKNKQIPNSTI